MKQYVTFDLNKFNIMHKLLSIVVIGILLLSCNKKLNKGKDTVIVIGAGISGLAAAQELIDNGVENVIVLEAQDKVGGRLKTNYSASIPFDEGASWIHGPIGNPLTDLATKAGLTTFMTDDENVIVYDYDGTEYTDAVIDQMDADYTVVIKGVEKDGSSSQSFETVFNNNYSQYASDRFWKYMLSAYLEFDTGGDITNLSSLYFYDDEEYTGEDVIITNGFDKLSNYLSSDLDVRLGQKVSKIDYDKRDRITVTTGSEVYQAKAVICTVPLGVLKAGVISFIPELPEETKSAIDQLQMGAVNKYLLEWDTAFWDTNEQYIGYTPETKGKFNYFININKFASINALMTFAFGDYSRTTELMSDQEVIDEIMNHLRTIYGLNIPEPSNMLRTKWTSNEFTFGSYSFVASGGSSDAYDVLTEAVDDRIFFAGEHTSFDYRGTVHGAYNSGIEAATELLKEAK
jgi:monoamine oxidase